jgi:hypothetical protein
MARRRRPHRTSCRRVLGKLLPRRERTNTLGVEVPCGRGRCLVRFHGTQADVDLPGGGTVSFNRDGQAEDWADVRDPDTARSVAKAALWRAVAKTRPCNSR